MIYIAIQRVDGGVSILQIKGEEALVDDILFEVGKWESSSGRRASAWEQISPESIPEDRTYRDALRWTGGKLTHDMEACRELHRNFMREARRPRLLSLDGDRAAAIRRGENAKVVEIDLKAEELANVTGDERITAARTPEELKFVWPEMLGENPLLGKT